MVANHLKGTYTYGVFNGGYVNKFITFDVDCAENSDARYATLRLIDVLIEQFSISVSDIHVSLSGGKGYHVDLFFEKPIAVVTATAIYEKVMKEVGKIHGGEIEFRPTFKQAVKLPLGTHRKTGNRCWFCDPFTLDPFEGDASYEYLAQIEPMAETPNIELTAQQAEEFTEVVRKTDITVNTADREAGFKRVVDVLKASQLIESNSRHKVTFDLARFFNEQGSDESDAVNEIMAILMATPRDYFSADSTPDHWLSEAKRIVSFSYERGYTFGNENRPITVYKSEILAVLSCGTFKTKQMLYAMLVTSKRYGKTFYLTRSTAMKMIGTKSRETATNTIKRIIEGGYAEYVRKGEVDKAKSQQTGHTIYKPNKYKLLISKIENDISVEVSADADLIQVANLLCDKKEIRKYVKRTEYNGRWRQYA
jgi:hypothetical protein